ncbi:ABC transporter ATP-binding protein [Nocardioides terrisoli]|uniref:ABC transporter ATP-binding protein n=1 Tax=Nocardioides terrisoli TaxID=3388267 RepID=UPI00287B92DF|nr:ABC transporter ATP-binding protein [Nocardioides marmorisolisilvae]
MLRINGLSVRYDDTVAVDDLDLTVPDGSVLAVLGPSGCGKSTLLRAIAGLEDPSSGSIAYDGHDLAGVPTYQRGFALMFQDGQLFAHQSVGRNVGYPMRLRHRDRAATRARVAELLELVGLTGMADRMPATLSGGERQRVALARALAVDPRLLLLDEPLSALDRGLRDELANQLREILHAAGTTALMVTHDQEEAFAVADRMAVMRSGRLVQDGTVAEVWGGPADAWTAQFLGYATVLTGPAALAVRREVEPAGDWTSVALRRSALRVSGSGPFAGTVRSVRATPELTRLGLDVDGIGSLQGVADPDTAVRPGDRVRLAVDRSRLATLPERSGADLYTDSS